MYRGEVTKATAAGVWLEVPDIVPGAIFGPCQWIGTAPAVGASALVVDVGELQSPDLIVVGELLGTLA